MDSKLKDRLRRLGDSPVTPQGPTKVLVALRTGRPDAACLARLRGHGLTVEEVIGDKVVGSIAADAIPALKADPDVVEVEPAVRLKLH